MRYRVKLITYRNCYRFIVNEKCAKDLLGLHVAPYLANVIIQSRLEMIHTKRYESRVNPHDCAMTISRLIFVLDFLSYVGCTSSATRGKSKQKHKVQRIS